MTNQAAEPSSAQGRKLLPVFVLLVLGALAVRSVLHQVPALASEALPAAAVRQAQTPANVAEAEADFGPGEDEAAVAKCPEK